MTESIPTSSTQNWQPWLREHFAPYVTAPFAPRHVRLWEWFEALQPGTRPRPRAEAWPRGGAKSASVELGCARVAVTGRRRFVLYVSETQPQADKHVQAIATALERLGEPRAVNEYGASKGWRHQELRTARGFNVVSYGIDSAVRGVKLDEVRPDLIVFDDFDARGDTEATRLKKISAITTSILPAGSADCAVLVVQNLVYRDSIMDQLVQGTADFLHDRDLAVLEPAVRDLAVERVFRADGAGYRIMAGEPTWAGQNLATCEQQINSWGLAAFLREAQHEVDEVDGGPWDMARDIEPFRVTQAPPLMRVAVALDPSATAAGDEAGIVAGGVDVRGHGYLLEDVSLHGDPKRWAEATVALYHRTGARQLVAESNQGGQMISTTIATVPGAPPVTLIHASDGKEARADPIVKLCTDGRIHHVGHFTALERELATWHHGLPSPNRLDAYVHLWTQLLLQPQPVFRAAVGPPRPPLPKYVRG